MDGVTNMVNLPSIFARRSHEHAVQSALSIAPHPPFPPSSAEADNGIVVHAGAVGVDVLNNYIHDYGFAGIRCGDYISYQGDCMLTMIFRNHVYSAKSNVTGDGDAAGIYYNTHIYNPGGRGGAGWLMRGCSLPRVPRHLCLMDGALHRACGLCRMITP